MQPLWQALSIGRVLVQEKLQRMVLKHKARRAQLSLDVAELADKLQEASKRSPRSDRYSIQGLRFEGQWFRLCLCMIARSSRFKV